MRLFNKATKFLSLNASRRRAGMRNRVLPKNILTALHFAEQTKLHRALQNPNLALTFASALKEGRIMGLGPEEGEEVEQYVPALEKRARKLPENFAGTRS